MDVRSLLLSNELDALDRLFDRKVEVVDVYATTYATAQALRTDEIFPLFSEAAAALAEILRTDLSPQAAREQALSATNALRVALAEALPWPSGKEP